MFISEPGENFTDFIFLASGQPIDIRTQGLAPEQSQWLQERLFTVDATGAAPLTDNLNPLEHLQLAKAEHYRRFLVDMFGAELFVR